MPSWVKDEDIWEKAKKEVDFSKYDEPYAVVTEVYKNMGGEIGKKESKQADAGKVSTKVASELWFSITADINRELRDIERSALENPTFELLVRARHLLDRAPQRDKSMLDITHKFNQGIAQKICRELGADEVRAIVDIAGFYLFSDPSLTPGGSDTRFYLNLSLSETYSLRGETLKLRVSSPNFLERAGPTFNSWVHKPSPLSGYVSVDEVITELREWLEAGKRA